MSSESESLHKKLADLLSWERRKRREQTLATIFCYALLAALLTLPFHGLMQAAINRWFIPLLFFGLMAPFFLFRERWRSSDSARALACVDKTLRLDERALTAWEFLERKETRAAALLVFKQAGGEACASRSQDPVSQSLELAGLLRLSASCPLACTFMVRYWSPLR